MTISEFLLLTTIRIETITPNGICTGTGFFFNFLFNKETGMSVPAIVTNKHVIKDAIKGKLRFSLRNEAGEPQWGHYYDLTVEDFEKAWILHPEGSVDLCIMPIAEIHKMVQSNGINLHYTALCVDDIPSDQDLKDNYSRVEDITIVGYPDGIWDAANNMPIVRKGITATALQLDFNNAPKFLVDAAIYGGSSGSPVFVFNQGSYSPANGGLVAGSRIKLVGVIHAVAQHTVTGDIRIIDVPVSKAPIVATNIPNNLGVAIHARKLKDFEVMLRERV